ncbi:hypothetical protein [uncultured Roseibium sp.]|uniref:hypothetical protein n=1 Tax=uncultured Roseibium sp. TaxID=1936171 RepID=UPI00260CD1A7|nr:hypothetical protein [uncultured Roseibium sp.]
MEYKNARTLIAAISSHFLPFRNLNAKRLLGIAFLCDWKHCIEFGTPITECDWAIVGNWVDSEEFLYSLFTCENPTFETIELSACPVMVDVVKYPYQPGSSQDIVCKHVFTSLEKRTDFDLDKIILSTFPFNSSGPIDMAQLSKEYATRFGRQYASKMIA